MDDDSWCFDFHFHGPSPTMTVAAESQPTPSISSMTAHIEQIVNALSLSPDDVRRVTKHLVRQLSEHTPTQRIPSHHSPFS